MKKFGVVARLKTPQGCVGVWVNIYRRNKSLFAGGSYKTRKEADTVAKSYRWDCVFTFVHK